MSAFPPDSTPTPTRSFPSKMGSYFSLAQWQELELQALIFRHMLAGSAVPPELLHLLKKSLDTSPPPSFRHLPFQHYSPYPPPWYWGRAAMDPEPGRCRRTDGKKWRCSRDVVAGQKYCERHVHRGRNRSRKPVEIPTPPSSASVGSGGGGGVALKTNTTLLASQPPTGITSCGTPTDFTLSGSSPSTHLPHTQRPAESSKTETKDQSETHKCGGVPGDGNSGDRVLRHFFDDWPRSLQQPDVARNNSSPVTSSAGFLKLSTGSDGDGSGPGHPEDNSARERVQLNWGEGWASNPVAPTGGPLGEALRSSTTSNSSPTSVLHQLPRSSTSQTN